MAKGASRMRNARLCDKRFCGNGLLPHRTRTNRSTRYLLVNHVTHVSVQVPARLESELDKCSLTAIEPTKWHSSRGRMKLFSR